MSQTISFSRGDVALDHDKRKFKGDPPKHIDPALEYRNIYIKTSADDGNIESEFNRIYADDVAEYNDRQKRSDRRIDNFYRKCLSNQKLNNDNLMNEFVVQIGDRDTYKQDEKKILRILKAYAENFETINRGQFRAVSAVIHHDEPQGSPHLHITFVPYATHESKYGTKHSPSLSMALDNLGFSYDKKERSAIKEWKKDQEARIEKAMNHLGIDRAYGDGRKIHMDPEKFRAVMDEKDRLERENTALKEEIENIKEEKKTLISYMGKLRSLWDRVKPFIPVIKAYGDPEVIEELSAAAEVMSEIDDVPQYEHERSLVPDKVIVKKKTR